MPGAPIPYYKPVAPEVPVADNTAAKIIASGNGPALFAQMALAKERDALEREQMLQQADLAAKSMELKREDMTADHEYRMKSLEVMKSHYDAVNTYKRTALNDMMNTTAQIASLKADAEASANEYRLNDPEFQTKDPVGFAQNKELFKQEWGSAPNYTGIPDKIKEWDSLADQQQVNVKFGAQLEGGEWKGGEGKMMPIWKVVRGLQNPNEYEMWKNALAAGGHITLDEREEPVPDKRNAWQKILPKIFGGKDPSPSTKTVPAGEKYDPLAADIFGKTKSYDFTTRKASKMPTFTPKGAASTAAKTGQETYDTNNPEYVDPNEEARLRMDSEVSLPVEPEALPDTSSAVPASATELTGTEKIIASAKIALTRGANPGAVAQRLREMSIDPNLIWA